MRKIFFLIICLVVGAVLFIARPIFAQDELTTYEDINIRVSYPDWPDIKNTLPSASGIEIAVSNGECSFILSALPLDSGSFKGFINQVIKEQTKQMKIKFNTKKIAANSFDLDSTIKANDQTIRQYAHGLITPANVIYQLTFTSLAENYKDLCQPYVKPMLKSIKTIKPKLSEKVNSKDFKKYFKDLNIGSKPEGENNLNKFFRANIIATDAAICFKGKVIKNIPEGILGLVIYDVDNGANIKEESAAEVIKKGNFTSCSRENLPAGRYEYKILVNGVVGAIYPFLVRGEAAKETVEAETVDKTLSEQPDKNKFNEYFTNIHLAKLSVGAEFDPGKIIKTKIFAAGEQFCTSLDMKKQIPANTLSSAVYDVNAKQDAEPRSGTFPQALGPGPGENMGNSIGCEPLAQATGKYEYKIYVSDILVAVLPFEVK